MGVYRSGGLFIILQVTESTYLLIHRHLILLSEQLP